MSDGNVAFRFEILDESGNVVEVEELDRDVVKIGKLASSHLKLDDPSVSRIHGVIEEAGDDGYTLIDLGSAEGTFVNGEQVTKEPIESGDELGFGDQRVRVEFIDPAEVGAGTTGQGGGAATVTTPEGETVEPFTLQGYYDEGGNYIPGYYDDQGQYHLGYGYYDDDGMWQVASGYYDPQGNWVATEEPVESAVDLEGERAAWERTSDRDVYRHDFFEDQGGDTLEIAHLWGDHVLAVDSFEPDDEPEKVTLGPSGDEDFQVGDGAVEGSYPLVVFDGTNYQLLFEERMTGSVRRNGEEYTLQELVDQGMASQSKVRSGAYAVRIDPTTSAAIEFEGHTFLVHFTKMPRGIGGGIPIETEPLPYLGLSAAAHILFLLAAMTLPGDAGSLTLDQYSDQNRFVEVIKKPKQKKKKKPDFLKKGDEKKAAKHKGEETKAGKKEADSKNKEMAIKGPKNNQNTKLKKAQNKKIAMNAGIMKSFKQDQVASQFGSSSQSVGSDAIHALGNLDGESQGASQGMGGLGLEGAGRGGGGGMSERGVGIGNVGTAGRGGGGRGGTGEGAADLGKKKERKPEVVPQRPDVDGALDKEIIRKVVRQHRREIKYCYEKELEQNPTMEGRVVIQFTISPAGDVVAALIQKSTLGNTTVETCMQGKIRRWKFPSPKGGGVVKVNYPFNFSSSEAE